jgi:CO/xanthine dehydrogenase Mo-binding subunit
MLPRSRTSAERRDDRARDTAALIAAAAAREPAVLPRAWPVPRRRHRTRPAACRGCLRSPHPHARIVSVSLDAARRLPGVHAAIAGADLPTAHRLGIQVRDRPALAVDVVRHIGEPVAAVAADTPRAARGAGRDRGPLGPAADARRPGARALAPGAPALHPGGNLLHARRASSAAIEAAFGARRPCRREQYATERRTPKTITYCSVRTSR